MLNAKILLLAVFIGIAAAPVQSQKLIKRIKETAKRTAEQKTEQKTSEGVEKGIDKGLEGARSIFKKKKKLKDGGDTEDETDHGSGLPEGEVPGGMESGEVATKDTGFGVYTQFTFEPGNRILYYEDFSKDALGDFPATWETSGSGEVVTNSGAGGNWLSITGRAGYYPSVSELPENYTIEFDVLTHGFSNNQQATSMTIAFLKKKSLTTGAAGGAGEVVISLHKSASITVRSSGGDGSPPISSKLAKTFPLDQDVHVSMAVNKKRLRVWLEEEKIIDIPSLLPGNLGRYILFQTYGIDPDKGHTVLLSNFRIAEAGKDIRSTLLDSGKFSTTGIYFNTDEAVIKPESYAVIKSVADYLQQHPEVKIQVIGHTDDQGEEAYNQELSEKRAAAVVHALAQEFGIDAGRLESTGKGETEPVEANTSGNGRANNRRVEFVKR